MMKNTATKMNKAKSIILILLLSFTLAGCFEVNGNFRHTRNKILDNLGNEFRENIEFSVGYLTMQLAGIVASFDIEQDRDILSGVSEVQIGVYDRDSHHQKSNAAINFKLLKKITAEMEAGGWNCIVRAVDNGEMNAVLVGENGSSQLNKIFVINISEDELVLAEISGNLNKIIETAIRDNGLDFNLAVN